MRDSVAPRAANLAVGVDTAGPAGEGLTGRISAYLQDAFVRELETTVVSAGLDTTGHYAVLADTILYPAGGGQPADRGWLEFTPAGTTDPRGHRLAVTDVRRVDGDVRHYVGGPPPDPSPCRIVLDWPRRFDHMQQHTGQHLLTAVAHEVFGWPTTSFHLGPDLADIELDVATLAQTRLDSLEEAVAAEIRAARPVSVQYLDPGILAQSAIRTRGLPEGHVGPARIIQIDGVDACACGGTHVANTAQIEALKLLHTEPMRGGTRLHFVAGARARRRLGVHEARMALLRGLMGTSDEEVAPAIEARLAKAADVSRRLADTEKRLAGALASELAAQPGPVVVARVEASLVTGLAQAFSRLAANPLLLAAASEPSGPFSLASGLGSGINVQVAGQTVAPILGGRGGGSGPLYQGKGDRLDRLDEAAAALADSLVAPRPAANAGEIAK